MPSSNQTQSAYPHETALTFARHEDGEVTTLAILTLGHQERLFKGDVRNKLSEAITEWVNTTDSGKVAWEDSSHDFNVGDLGMYVEDPDLARILSSYGMEVRRLILADEGSVQSFDTVLVDTDQID